MIQAYIAAVYDKHTKGMACSRKILASDKKITLLQFMVSNKNVLHAAGIYMHAIKEY